MRILVTPEAMRNAAEQQMRTVDSINESAARIRELGDELGEAWEGASGEQARDALGEISAQLRRLIEKAGETARMPADIADAFESVDGGIFSIGRMLNFGLNELLLMPSIIFSARPGMIRIDPDRVREIAEQCRAVSSSLSENAESYMESADSLTGQWDGRAYMKYKERVDEIVKILRELTETMEDFVKVIINAADSYEKIDNTFMN